jgi:hypothetical protein
MAPDGSPLALLAQQGAAAVNLVIAEKLAGVPRGEPEVKPHLQLVQGGIYLSMMRATHHAEPQCAGIQP